MPVRINSSRGRWGSVRGGPFPPVPHPVYSAYFRWPAPTNWSTAQALLELAHAQEVKLVLLAQGSPEPISNRSWDVKAQLSCVKARTHSEMYFPFQIPLPVNTQVGILPEITPLLGFLPFRSSLPTPSLSGFSWGMCP